MKRMFAIVSWVLVLIFPVISESKNKTQLPERFAKWIEEEVVYIITPTERDVFFKLETDELRDKFIEEFWKQRDPTPGSVRNEFKDEHYSRIEYANEKFGRGTPFEGWRTDRGRIYITLGKPVQLMRYGGDIGICFPAEIWYYQGDPGLGQPPFFRLLFFKRGGVGAFDLYSPMTDGPKSLIPQIAFYPNPDPFYEDKAAYQHLRVNVSPELADASWSAFPISDGRKDLDFSSDRISSSILVEKVRTYPYLEVEDDYAIEFLEHEAVVEVSYSVDHMNSFSQVNILQEPSGMFFVNYSIEPETLAVDFFKDRYFTNIKNSARVTDPLGKTIFQHEDIYPIELEEKQIKSLGQRPFHLYDSFPLVPGQYTLNLLLENTVTKEFTSIEKDILVPELNSLSMSPLILADKVDKDSPYSDVNKAFQIGKLQLYPSMRNRFSRNDRLYVFFQLYGIQSSIREKASLKFTFYDESEELSSTVKKLSEYESGQEILEEFELEEFPSGKYGIRVSVIDESGREVLFENQGFSVYLTSFPEPWVVYKTNPPSTDPEYFYVLGNQLMNKGETNKALDELKKAYDEEPDFLDFALSYTKALLLDGQYSKAEEILKPFVEEGEEDFELFEYLGISYMKRERWEDALLYFEKSLAHKGNVISIINSIGHCWIKLGETSRAVLAFEKSLALDPAQKKIEGIVNELKKEKRR
jgi:GWxTD domain-containing protein